MYERKAAPWVVGCLLLLGCLAFGLRLHALQQATLTERSGRWRLGYDVSIEVDQAGVEIQLAVPRDTPFTKVVRQNVSYSELRQGRLRSSPLQSKLSFVAPQPGHYQVSARFDLDLRRSSAGTTDVEPAPSLRDLERSLRPAPSIQTGSTVVSERLASLRREGDSAVDQLRRIFDYCHTAIDESVAPETPSDAEEVLRQGVGTPLGRVHAMIALTRASQFATRLVTGFEIREQAARQPDYWLEVYTGDRWEAYDPLRGFAAKMPPEFIPIVRGSEHVVAISDQSRTEVEFSIHRVGEGGFASSTRQHPADIFDLDRLPISMHETLAVILLLPLGALVTAIFQTIIGIRTIGTFSPTLIALSFVLADWRTGVAVFALVILVGLLSRALLDRLKLLMVPRLGFMLTLVVAILVFTISILDFLRFTPSHQAVLLPLVILTMTVERFYVATAEDGIRSALKLMLGTMLVSFCCYLTLGWQQVGSLVFRFPEIHLVTLAAFVYLGRYTGYRLTELWRFRDLVTPQEEASRP